MHEDPVQLVIAATQSQSEHGAAHIYPYKQTQITHDTDNTHTTQRDIQRGHVETSLKPYRKGRKRGGFKSLICLQTNRRTPGIHLTSLFMTLFKCAVGYVFSIDRTNPNG